CRPATPWMPQTRTCSSCSERIARRSPPSAPGARPPMASCRQPSKTSARRKTAGGL
ncbi:hypothetical protein AVDCRST_MAG82-2870, partial [uncultured Rubrobacteraceae bacterium]